jgi:hypothetical protein
MLLGIGPVQHRRVGGVAFQFARAGIEARGVRAGVEHVVADVTGRRSVWLAGTCVLKGAHPASIPARAPHQSNNDMLPVQFTTGARGRWLVKRRRCAVNVFDALGQTLHEGRPSDRWQGLATTRPVLLGPCKQRREGPLSPSNSPRAAEAEAAPKDDVRGRAAGRRTVYGWLGCA